MTRQRTPMTAAIVGLSVVLAASCSGEAQSDPAIARASQLSAEWSLEPFTLVKFYSTTLEPFSRPDPMTVVVARQYSWASPEQRVAMHATLSGVKPVLDATSKANDAWFAGCFDGAGVAQHGEARRAVIDAMGDDRENEYFPLLASRATAARAAARLKMDDSSGGISPSLAVALASMERSLNERLTPEAALAFARLRVPGCSAPAYVDALNQLELALLQAVSTSTAPMILSASATLKDAVDNGLGASRESLRQRFTAATRAARSASSANTTVVTPQLRALRESAAKTISTPNR